jgi:hypothetical protein
MEILVSLSAWDGQGTAPARGGASLEMRRGRKIEYLDIPLKDSIKGWRLEWFIVENHGNSLPPRSGRQPDVRTPSWTESPTDLEVAEVKGKCALGPFLSILVIECKHKGLNVKICSWMNKVQITSKGMFLSLSTLVLCTNIFV